jgi:hypothetical protein
VSKVILHLRMPSWLQVLAEGIFPGLESVAARPQLGSDVIGVAAQICNLRKQSGKCFSLLTVPTSEHQSAAKLVTELATALGQIDGKSVLVVEFSSARIREFPGTTLISSHETALTSTTTHDDLFEENQMMHFVKATLCGPNADPVASACSEAFAAFLAAAQKRFSYILIEVPSATSSIVSLLIAPHCDGVLLTVGKGKSTISGVEKVMAAMQRAKARVIGYVFDLNPATLRR